MSALTRLQAYLLNMRNLPPWTYPKFAQQVPIDFLGIFAGTTTGTSTAVPPAAWSAFTIYTVGQKVTSGALVYASLANGNVNHVPPNATWWALSAADRYPSAAGASNGEFYLVTDVSPPQTFTWYNGAWYPLATSSGTGGGGGGTVLAVTATAPVVSSGGASPDISMAPATAIANGYMTSAYASKLDGIEAGANLYVLPIASAGSLGGIRVGTNLSIDGSGVLSGTVNAYTLPIASAGTLGGIKVGSGLSIDGSGVLSASGTGAAAATTSALGTVKLTVTDQVPSDPVVPNRSANGSMTVTGHYSDGASAVGVILNNDITLANATSKLLSIQNNGAEKGYVLYDGSHVIPNNTGYKQLDDGGVVRTVFNTGADGTTSWYGYHGTTALATVNGALYLWGAGPSTGPSTGNGAIVTIGYQGSFGVNTGTTGLTAGQVYIKSYRNDSNPGTTIDTNTAYSANKVLSISSAGSEKAYFTGDGTLGLLGYAAVSVLGDGTVNHLGYHGQSAISCVSGITYVYGSGPTGGYVGAFHYLGYFGIGANTFTDTGIHLKSAWADGASSKAITLNTSTAYTNITSKLVSVQNNGVEKAYIDYLGQVYTPLVSSFPNTLWQAQGTIADGASAVAIKLNAGNVLTVAGAKIISVTNNNVEKAYIDKDGIVAAPSFRPLTATSAILRGAVASSLSAVATILDNSITLTHSTAKIVSFQNNGTERAYIDYVGLVVASAFNGANLVNPTANLLVQGNVTDGATAIGVKIGAGFALTTAGAKIASFTNATVEKAYVDKDGNLSIAGLIGTPVTVSNISATGTPSATTYLRGDGTWSTPAGGSAPTITDDTTTNADMYLVFNAATSGAIAPLVSSTKLFYHPSNGFLGVGVSPTGGRLHLGGDVHTVMEIDGTTSGRVRLGATTANTGTRNFEFQSNAGSGVGSFRLSSLNDAWGLYINQYILSAAADGSMGFNTSTLTTAGYNFVSPMADSGSAIGMIVNTGVAYTTTAKLLSVQNNSVEKFYVDQGGSIWATTHVVSGASGNVYSGAGGFFANSAVGASVRGSVADGAAAVGVTLNNTVTLANATSKLLSIQNNSVEKAWFDYQGYMQAAGFYIRSPSTNGSNRIYPSGSQTNTNQIIECVANSDNVNSASLYLGISNGDGWASPLSCTMIASTKNGTGTTRDLHFWAQNQLLTATNMSLTIKALTNLVGINNPSPGAALGVKSVTADGATAAALIVDTSTTWANTSARLLSLRNNTSEKIAVEPTGKLTSQSTINLSLGNAVYWSTVAAVYADINSTLNVRGNASDGASAIGVILNNNITLTNLTSKIVSFQNAGVEKAYVDYTGDITAGNFILGAGVGKALYGAVGYSSAMIGRMADGASAISVVLNSNPGLTVSGAKLLSVQNATVEKFWVDKDGNVGSMGGYWGTSFQDRTGAAPLNLLGNMADGPSAIAAKISSIATWANVDAKLAAFYNAATVKAYITAKGGAWFGDFVGIGATAFAPSYQLEVVDETLVTNRGINVAQHNTGVHGAAFNFLKTRGTRLSPTAVANGDYGGFFANRFRDTASTNVITGGFGFRVNGTVGSNSVPTDMFFYTNAATTGDPYTDGTVRMILGSTGLYALNTTTLTTAGINMISKMADGATAIGLQLNTAVAYNTTGAKLFSILNNSVEKSWMDKDGSLAVAGNYTTVGTSAGVTLLGKMANGAAAIGTILDTSTAWSTAGAKLLSIRNNAVEKLAVDMDGLLTWPDGQTLGLDPAGNAGRLQVFTSRAAIDASGDFVIDTVNDRTNSTALLSVRNQGTSGLLDVRGDGYITTHHGFKSSDGGNPYSFMANNQDTGGPATAVVLDNLNTLTDAGSKLLSVRNNTAEKAYLDVDGRLYHGITWDDMQGPANAALIGASAPTNEQYRDTLARLMFLRHDQDDSLTFSYQTSHRWIRDTEVRVHIHYIPMATPATDQVVRIQYSYAWAHPNTAVPANAGWTTSFTDITIPASGADTHNEKLASLFNTTPTGSKESSILIVNITRLSSSASDTYTTSKADNTAQANFCVLSVDCHYQSNKEGTVDPIPA